MRDAFRTVDRLHRATAWVLSPHSLAPLTLLATLMAAVVVARLESFLADTGALFRRPAPLVLVCVLLWVSGALHEWGHGVVARHFGGTVSEIGLSWRFPVVILYSEVDDYLYLRKRWHQVATAMAGPVTSLFLLLPAVALWWSLPPGTTRQTLSALLLLGIVQALVNFVPLPPLDGYRMVSHAVGVLDYAVESRRFLRRLGQRISGRRDAVAAYSRKARVAYCGYGTGAALILAGAGAGLVVASHHLLADRYGPVAVIRPGRRPGDARRGRRRRRRTDRPVRPGSKRKRGAMMSGSASPGAAIVVDDVHKRYGTVQAVRSREDHTRRDHRRAAGSRLGNGHGAGGVAVSEEPLVATPDRRPDPAGGLLRAADRA